MEILKKLRNSFNLTQKELAEKVGINFQTISQYEYGRHNPSFISLKKLVKFFNVSTDYFLLGDKCNYHRNLLFLESVKKIENLSNTEVKNAIKLNILSLLKNGRKDIKLDNFILKLTDNFHSNLKKIRNMRKLTKTDMASKLDISLQRYNMYEYKNKPTNDIIMSISVILDVSIHSFVTGQKLNYKFQDKELEKTVLLADHFLTLEQQKFLISQMEGMIKNS